MTYKAYIDNIKLQTGKTPEDFVELAKRKGFIINGETIAKHGEMLAWLKTEMGLGHGHANAIILYLKAPEVAKKKIQEDTKKSRRNRTTQEGLSQKAHWDLAEDPGLLQPLVQRTAAEHMYHPGEAPYYLKRAITVLKQASKKQKAARPGHEALEQSWKAVLCRELSRSRDFDQGSRQLKPFWAQFPV